MTMTAVAPATETVGAEGLVCGAVLRGFRRQLGLTQEALGERLFVDKSTYVAWENGRRPLNRIPVHRFRSLCRALVDIGVSPDLIGALDVAIDVDLDIARALATGENLFPPNGCNETWHALLAWALTDRRPVMFAGWNRAESPRLCARDRNSLLKRIRYAVTGANHDVDEPTRSTLRHLYCEVS